LPPSSFSLLSPFSLPSLFSLKDYDAVLSRCDSAGAMNDKLARLLGGPEHEKRQEALRVGKKEVTVGEVQGGPPHKRRHINRRQALPVDPDGRPPSA
jgi:hypothetical protein